MSIRSLFSRAEYRWIFYTIAISVACIGAFFFKEQYRLYHISVVFVSLFFIYDFPASFVALLVAAVGALCIDRHGRISAMLSAVSYRPVILAFAVFLLTATGAWFVYHAHPLSMDEYSVKLQSEIFAAGHLSGKYPTDLLDVLIPKGFQGAFIEASHTTGAISSIYWPAFALVMTPFTRVGVPWLCNPFLTFCTVLCLAALLETVVKNPAARGYGLLATVCSPVIIVNGMSFYGMPLQLLGSAIFTLGVIKGTPRYLFFAGIAGAISMTAVNPFPFALYALPWIAWLVLSGKDGLKKIIWLALGGLPLLLLLGLGWKEYLLLHYHGADAGMAAHVGRVARGIFTWPFKALLIARGMAMVKLWLWAVPGVIVLAAMAFGIKERPYWVSLLACSALLSWVGYMFVPFDQGHGWGYRYFHTAWLALPLLAATTLERISLDDAKARARIYGFAFATCMGTLFLSLPLRLYQVESFIGDYLAQLPPRLEGKARQLVFVNLDCGATSDLIQNDPFLRGNEIRLISHGEEADRHIAERFGSKPHIVSKGMCGQRWALE